MLIPTDEKELADAISSAKGPLSIRGGNTRGFAADGTPLATTGLSGISLYEPGALTLVAAAGTPIDDIQDALAAEGQRLPFEPIDHRPILNSQGTPTIGGVVAANVSGPRRVQAGACRDSLIGVRFVDGKGTIIKNGGRVMKNVTGYDLVKLMAGSYGTLGVISEVAFKVLPAASSAACVLIEGLTDANAIKAMSRALGSPFDVSGAAHVPVGLDGTPVTMIRLEGFEKSVRYRANELKNILDEFGDINIELDPANVAKGWAWIGDATPFVGTNGDIWRVSVKPSDAPELVAKIAPQSHLYDWGGGLIWVEVASGTDVRAAMRNIQGHATRIRGDGHAPKFHPEAPLLAKINRELRQKFDPRGILNPSLMG